jgi:2-oxoglutarate ferredoxin oxidoreductase subunit gamma
MIKMICSGLGGQGVLTMGMLIATIATNEGKYVTWVPSYGSQMRGGSANCLVKISDEPIVSPYASKVDILVALSPSALSGNKEKIADEGLLIVNSSVISDIDVRDGIRIVYVPANAIAEKNNNPKGMNLSIIGAIIKHSGITGRESAVKQIAEYFQKKGIVNEANVSVFAEGYDKSKEELWTSRNC